MTEPKALAWWRRVALEAIKSNPDKVTGLLADTSSKESAVKDFHAILRALGEKAS